MSNPKKAPYLLTKQQWNDLYVEAKDQIRNYQHQYQGAVTIDYLGFGVRDDIIERLSAVQKGDIVLSPWCSLMLVARIEATVTYGKVRARAKRLGLL